MTQAHGPDYSFWSQRVDFSKFTAQRADFSIHKATQANWTDRYFPANWIEAKKTGRPRGAYHWFVWNMSAAEQAQHFAKVMALSGVGEIDPIVDYEDKVNIPERHAAHDALLNFVDIVEDLLQCQVMIYTNPDVWKNYGYPNSRLGTRKLWIANYKVIKPQVPAPWTDWEFWQWTAWSDGYAYGSAEKDVDMNWYNGTVEQFHAKYDPKPRFDLVGDLQRLAAEWARKARGEKI